MRITVQPYSPQRTRQFHAIKHELEEALSGVSYIGIEHVGSTSVPGLTAKPVIDIDITMEATQMEPVKEPSLIVVGMPMRAMWAFRSDMVSGSGPRPVKESICLYRRLSVATEQPYASRCVQERS